MENQKSNALGRLVMSSWFLSTGILIFFQYFMPQELGPLTVLKSFAPYTLLTFALIGFLLITRSNIIQWDHQQMRYIWITFLVIFLITPFADRPQASLGMSKNMVMYIPLMLSMLVVISDVKKLKYILNLFIGITVGTGIITILKVDPTGASTGNSNFLENANEFALFAGMIIPYCYFMMIHESSIFKKLLYAGAGGVILLAIIATLSRAGLVGLMAAGMVMWWYSPKKTFPTIIGVLVIMAGVYIGGKAYMDEMSTITDTTHSTAVYRFQMWKEAWNLFLEKPMGRGLRSSSVIIRGRGDTPMENHSVWLTSLVETGIIGFWFFVALWYVNIRDILYMAKQKVVDKDGDFIRWFSLGSLGALAAYAGAGSFTHVFYYPHFWYISILVAVTSKLYFINQKEHSNA